MVKSSVSVWLALLPLTTIYLSYCHVLDLPPLLPRTIAGVVELDPVIEVPRRDIHEHLTSYPGRRGGHRDRVSEAKGGVCR
jgi:hypothetical protein